MLLKVFGFLLILGGINAFLLEPLGRSELLDQLDARFDSKADPTPRTCQTCEIGAAAAQSLFIANSTKNAIHKQIQIQCAKVKPITEQCVKFGLKYFDTLYSNLAAVTPTDLCAIFGLCPNAPHINFCPLCKEIISDVKMTVFSDEVLNKVIPLVESICDPYYPFITICKGLVHDMFLSALNSIYERIVPEKLCEAAGLCPKPKYYGWRCQYTMGGR
ncbi:hypothetical protein FGIG_04279 [Fasciola gigantica]|uniref:Saposin B-type domain-containing protein n=1 Tax=Fasciola gigantica TaxID=46835 RepID=A0A504YWA1_FASGI|nr:hypothetical protein FGIG_04279 [Fasciola gigantica]